VRRKRGRSKEGDDTSIPGIRERRRKKRETDCERREKEERSVNVLISIP